METRCGVTRRPWIVRQLGTLSFVDYSSGFVPFKFICIIIEASGDVSMYVSRISTITLLVPLCITLLVYGTVLNTDASPGVCDG